jgi:hypothetical protein
VDDKQSFVKTIKKCYLHRELTGKNLFEEVRKYNRENSPKDAEPDTIAGVLGFDFEPDWIKEVRKFPSVEKLVETTFNLETMKRYFQAGREFQYCLSNFLNSSTSVLWYLLEEYSRKYGFDINKYRKDDRYRASHEALVSGEANAFLSWYNSEFTILKNEKEGFLLDKRDQNIHQGYIPLILGVEHEFKYTGSMPKEMPVDWSKTSACFPENEKIKTVDLCASFVGQLKLLVEKAHARFPLQPP